MAKNDPKPAPDLFSKEFTRLLEAHCAALGLSKSELYNKTGEACGEKVELSYFSRWEKGERSVSRELAARFAVTIVKEYVLRKVAKSPVKNPPPDERLSAEGWEYLGWTLQRFYTAAGLVSHEMKIDEPSDIAWGSAKKSRELRIGWVECPPYAKSSSEGPCMQVASTVAKLLGLKPNPVPFARWADLARAIRTGEVHVAAPIMINTPDRLMDFSFAEQLPIVRFKIKALVDTTQWDTLPSAIGDIERADTMLGYVEEEVGHLAAQLSDGHSLEHKDLATALTWMKEGSRRDRRLIIAEAGTMETEAKRKTNFKALNFAELDDLEFGLCFATRIDEPALLHAINTTQRLAKAKIEKLLAEFKTEAR